MNNLNSIIIEENLVRECEVRMVGDGKEVCSFTIAVNRYYRKDDFPQKETGFFSIEAWGRLAKKVQETAVKGQCLRVVGRLKQERWSDREGKPQSKVVIAADQVDFKRLTKSESEQKDIPARDETAEEEYQAEELQDEVFAIPF